MGSVMGRVARAGKTQVQWLAKTGLRHRARLGIMRIPRLICIILRTTWT